MTLAQALVVLFIGLFAIKPKDIPVIIRKIKDIKSYIMNISQSNDLPKTEQLNFYIQKIINIEGYYDGDYDLVKEKYNKLIKSIIENSTP
ncbi:MAG: DUF2672 domain-containing protein [Rickettsia endosymbiont of Argas persicus]